MDYNTQPSSRENENNSNPNNNYTQWQKTMEDVKFKDEVTPAASTSLETAGSPNNPENLENSTNIVEKLLDEIQDVKEFVKNESENADDEELVELADDALVFVAKETIASADEDRTRTEAEIADIQDAVSCVVVQGAIEEAGLEKSAGSNPILGLNHEDTLPDLAASIDSLHKEGATLHDGESVAGLAERTIERNKVWNLTRVSEQLGSNEGGWYEQPDGERYYVKFYENPSQGKTEFVANAIYAKLGIKSVRSEIIQLEGREAIASLAVPEATAASKDSQIESEDVKRGFVADAFLGNWDVVGLDNDNIVQGSDGFYRIDNGGSLIFRAQGADKAYSRYSIPELVSMRQPNRPTGDVFASITDEDIAEQARDLVENLSPNDIRAIVDESGLKGEERNRVLTGLLGRREYLVNTFVKTSQENQRSEPSESRTRRSVNETIRMLSSQETELSKETLARPRSEIVCDYNHIEGQKIDVVSKKDHGTIEFRFKLRTPTELTNAQATRTKSETEETHEDTTTPSGEVMKRGKITYDGPSSTRSFTLCDAFVFEKDGVKVSIADPSSRDSKSESISDMKNNSNLIRSAMGLVTVEVPAEINPEETEKILGEILEQDFGISNALNEVPEEAEKQYKMARYKWQHAIAGDLTPEQVSQAETLYREEVFPGYTTLVERGKHKEYLDTYGADIRAVHHLNTGSASSIYRVLTQGLMCTTERYSRGIMRNGLSSSTDIDTGGADSVFTRVSTDALRENMKGSVVVLKPEIFDRTDWYTYDCDRYGTTDEESFAIRLSPDAIFSEIVKPHNSYESDNEQMFRTGIGANFVESIEVDSDSYDEIVSELHSMGLNDIEGKPIEEIIIARKSKDSVDSSASIYAIKNKLKAEKQAKIEALINGENHYTGIDDLFKLVAGNGGDQCLMSLVEAIVTHEGKEKIASDFTEFYIKSYYLDALRLLAAGKPTSYHNELNSFLQKTLDLDWGAIYEAAKIEDEQEQAKLQAQIDGFITGEIPYTSFNDLYGLAYSSNDPAGSFKSMTEAIISHVDKKKFIYEATAYIKEYCSLTALSKLASSGSFDGFNDLDRELVKFMKQSLNVDFSVVYNDITKQIDAEFD